MHESEKVENVVCARDIRNKLLEALHLGPGEFATALGINYQRIYDLGSGRVKKFNPGMVKLICTKFPQVNPTFLFSGKGDVLLEDPNAKALDASTTSDLISMSKRLISLMEQLNEKDAKLREREDAIQRKEEELDAREKRLRELESKSK